MEEKFIDIPGYEGYYKISNLGRVFGAKSNTIMKLHTNSTGYFNVGLKKDSHRTRKKVHILMAMTFLNHIPNDHVIVIDHINGIKTDNRLDNIRLVSHRKNTSEYYNSVKTTSKYTGVSWSKISNKWHAQIRINKKQTHLGFFDNEIDAYYAYQNALKSA